MFIIKFIRIQNLNQNFIIHRIVIIDLNIKFKKINLINLNIYKLILIKSLKI